MVEELLEEQYAEYCALFVEIRRVRICPKQIRIDYGKRAAWDMNATCPVVVARGGLPLAVLADGFGM